MQIKIDIRCLYNRNRYYSVEDSNHSASHLEPFLIHYLGNCRHIRHEIIAEPEIF